MSRPPTNASYLMGLRHVFSHYGKAVPTLGAKLSEDHPAYPAFAALRTAILEFPEEHLSLVQKANPKARKKRKKAASLMTYNPYQGARMAIWGGIPEGSLISLVHLMLPEMDALLLAEWIRQRKGGSGGPSPSLEE